MCVCVFFLCLCVICNGSDINGCTQEIGENSLYVIVLFGIIEGLFLWKRYKYWLFCALMGVVFTGGFVGQYDHKSYFWMQSFWEWLFFWSFYQCDKDMFGDMNFLNISTSHVVRFD